MTPEEVDRNEGMQVKDTYQRALVYILYRDGESAMVQTSQKDRWGQYNEYLTPITNLKELR